MRTRNTEFNAVGSQRNPLISNDLLVWILAQSQQCLFTSVHDVFAFPLSTTQAFSHKPIQEH